MMYTQVVSIELSSTIINTWAFEGDKEGLDSLKEGPDLTEGLLDGLLVARVPATTFFFFRL